MKTIFKVNIICLFAMCVLYSGLSAMRKPIKLKRKPRKVQSEKVLKQAKQESKKTAPLKRQHEHQSEISQEDRPRKKRKVSDEQRPQEKMASTFFEKWVNDQVVFQDINFRNSKKFPDTMVLYGMIRSQDPIHVPFVEALLGKDFVHKKNDSPNINNIAMFFEYLLKGREEFVTFLNTLSFNTSEIEARDQMEYDRNKFIETVKRYTQLAGILFPYVLFPRNGIDPREQFNFNLANRLFEYLFAWDGNTHNPIFNQQENYPILRFLYSNIQRYLVDEGWLHWSNETIRNLKDATQDGEVVTYIAGGCDIWQLIKNGIYKIDVIDPFFPSQEELYYVEGALWFVEGPIGDTLVFDNVDNGKKIIMQRDSCVNHNSDFTITTSKDGTISIPTTTTVWGVYNSKKEKIGAITFQRRLCTQADFNNQIIFMSLNEALLAFSPKKIDGWNMQVNKLRPNFKLYVKQLHKPIGKQELKNYSHTFAPDVSFSFIDLCILGS